MASVTAALTGLTTSSTSMTWEDNVSLGTTFSIDGTEQELNRLRLWDSGGTAGQVHINIVGPNKDFTVAFEASGRIIIEASDGETLEIVGTGSDVTEPYTWTPTNSAEVIAFANHVLALSDQTATLTLTDDPAAGNTAPSFTNDTGTAQSWAQDVAINAVTVPEADGTPTPTYAVQGSLPAGISFDTTTRVISGTPTATGSGSITVTCDQLGRVGRLDSRLHHISVSSGSSLGRQVGNRLGE